MIPFNIWIVEDDTGFRRILQRMLNRVDHITCARTFPSCEDLFETIDEDVHPDLLLMDLGLPGMGGVEGIQKLTQVAPEITVVVLTVFNDKQKVLDALDAGATGYLLKTASHEEILMGLQNVFLGGAALSPSIAKIVLQEMRKPEPSEEFDLSDREVEVLEQLAKGLSVQEIADALDIAHRTGRFHLSRIYEKLQVQSQAGAVAKALRAGII
ncbi:response regulator [Pontiella sulfatireligans]|uniref:Transcriptional regulatory protein DegU n=1 Tax=Pontiella sulfatireligans TaxID=2750658 RepID=A0A6C2UNH6_9BACT|nr:response regulator transcription factor [Pontiella sulfatireligans]VGO20874.1 Transcriptional regulatory protein DegU [Pontiella sulfatireligans]